LRKSEQIALLRFPQADLSSGKLRPVLLVAQLPGHFEDWLICMLSTQLHQALPGFDEVLDENQADFVESGLRIASIIRIARLAVVSAASLTGTIGSISDQRLRQIKENISDWIIQN
jgi:mRNA interferase MazF